MTSQTFYHDAHRAFRKLHDHTADPAEREHYKTLADEAWAHHRRAQRHADTLTFILHPGFVILGYGKIRNTISAPNKAGLAYAWHIFMHGPGGSSYLHATDFVGEVKGPAKALDNRLRDAAEWVEREQHFPLIATEIRSIKVSRAGEITYAPNRRIALGFE